MKFFTSSEPRSFPGDWRRYAVAFIAIFVGLLASALMFVLLIDPFGTSPIALPINRALVTVQRYMYPQLIRSQKFDSAIVGTSTSMLLDPDVLNGPFQARFANVAMASATAWEQKTLIDLFFRQVKQPKVLLIGLDLTWCGSDADSKLITFRGFPDWLYDDNPWNDYLNLVNRISFMSAVRLLRFHFGLYTPTMRADGMDTFLPPDAEYDLQRAYQRLYGQAARPAETDGPAPPPLSDAERSKLRFPALPWLDDILSKAPDKTLKILAFMPLHVQNRHPERAFEICKERVAEIGRRRGATVIDWRIPSAITLEDSNYWDPLHYRVPVATRIARELPEAVLLGKISEDGAYRLLTR